VDAPHSGLAALDNDSLLMGACCSIWLADSYPVHLVIDPRQDLSVWVQTNISGCILSSHLKLSDLQALSDLFCTDAFHIHLLCFIPVWAHRFLVHRCPARDLS